MCVWGSIQKINQNSETQTVDIQYIQFNTGETLTHTHTHVNFYKGEFVWDPLDTQKNPISILLRALGFVFYAC